MFQGLFQVFLTIELIFSSKVQVNGFEYIGTGSATNKKEAEQNAAKDFCGFLVGSGLVAADSLPASVFVSIM